MTTQPLQSHFDLKLKLCDALLGTELFKKQKESLFSNCGPQLNHLEGRNKSDTLRKHAVWLLIHPGCFAQLLPPALCSLPPLCAHSALPSASLKTIFSIQCVSFPTTDFLHWFGGCHSSLWFYPSLLTAKNTWRRRWGLG